MVPSLRTLIVLAIVVLFLWPGPGPVSLAYATSDSMEPTIAPGDGYLLRSTGSIQEGDIVTFWSPSREEYVTHRVVGVTDEGYLTQGDANPSTDQAAGYEPVPADRVRGVVLAVSGGPVVIPGFGIVAGALSGGSLWLLGIVGGVAVLYFTRASRTKDRDVVTAGDVLVPLFAVALLVGFTLPAVTGVSSHSVVFEAVEDDPVGPTEVRVGESAVRSVTFTVAQPPLSVLIVDSEGVSVTDRTHDGDRMHLEVRVPPSRHPGPIETQVTITPYPATLPPAVLSTLHGLHPFLALFASNIVVYLPLMGCYWLFVPGDTPLRPSRRRSASRGDLP